ncbi:MAG: diacylglycerol kinase [Asticcacaulis sp.]|nr:diacylglycerol kinase [Asticcacaulis sp.]
MAGTPFNILINAKSGTAITLGEDAIRAQIDTSQIPVAELVFAEPEDMHGHLERLSQDPKPLLIGGGDGTIRETACYLTQHKKPFGVLPFGTMNLLAMDLGLPTLQAALDAYAGGENEIQVDAGYVNDELFLCCASIGTMPEASIYREEIRKKDRWLLIPKMFWFVLSSLEKHKGERVVLEIGKKMKRFRTPAVVISNNRFKDSEKLTESNFLRASLDGGKLAAYIATTWTPISRLRFMSRLILGHWLQDPDLTEIVAPKITLWTRHKDELVSIDGEVTELKTPLHFVLKPKSVHLLVPAEAAA